MLKKIFFMLLLLLPSLVSAQTTNSDNIAGDKIFKAKIIEITEERTIEREGGTKAIQQNLLLMGLEKEWKDKKVEHRGISEIDVAGANVYRVGDKVLVSEVKNIGGATNYYIVDFVRSGYLYLLAFIFAMIVMLIGKKKGLKSLLSLIISFFVIIKFIVPGIIAGGNPLLIGVFGVLVILALVIYLTGGWNKSSHIAVVSVFCSLSITFALSWVFTNLARLTGMAQEEAVFLIGGGNNLVDFRGLLLTGILIGTVGVLDDVIVGQIESVAQIKKANPNLSGRQIYHAAYTIGNAHLGAIVNTLFLTYAGASLPLLLLFYLNPTGVVSFTQVINNEMIATEIVRTFVGSIGVALSLPISTFLATAWLNYRITAEQK